MLEAQVFDLTRAVAKGSYNQAAELLGSLLKLQEEPVMLLALLGKELRRLYTARVALDTGRDKFWLMEQWNIRFESIARQMLETPGGWTSSGAPTLCGGAMKWMYG